MLKKEDIKQIYLRVKTREELLKEFGKNWSSKVTWDWTRTMVQFYPGMDLDPTRFVRHRIKELNQWGWKDKRLGWVLSDDVITTKNVRVISKLCISF